VITYRLKLEKPCDLWAGHIDKDGYGKRWYHGKRVQAHRVAYCEHHGLTLDDIKGQIIRHKCDTPACIEPTHLLTGTNEDNVRDKMQRNRQARGQAVASAVLTIDKVRDIKSRLASGQSQTSVALEFGVAQPTVSCIKTGRNWGWV
jgi:hypothetical protein